MQSKYKLLAIIAKIDQYFARVKGLKIKETRTNAQCAIFSMSDNALADILTSVRSTKIQLRGGSIVQNRLRKRCCGCTSGISHRNKNVLRKLGKQVVANWKTDAEAFMKNEEATTVDPAPTQMVVTSRKMGAKNSMK